MKYSQASMGRIFIIRLEQGETVHQEIEEFARHQNINAAALIIVGGADQGSKFVVGPTAGEERPAQPLEHILGNVHEIAGVGTIFPDEDNHPIVHMHMACGRKDQTLTGCIRNGVTVWQVMEIILIELTDSTARRVMEQSIGFKLLIP